MRKVRESKNMVEWWEAVGKFRIRRKRTDANITKEHQEKMGSWQNF